MENIIIQYERGRMEINAGQFFPAAPRRFQRLLKVVDLDWEHREEIRGALEVEFREKIAEREERILFYRKQLGKYQQEEAEAGRAVEAKKAPGGIPLTKEELKNQKEKLKYSRTQVRNLTRELKTCEREKKGYMGNLQLLSGAENGEQGKEGAPDLRPDAPNPGRV